MAEFVHFAEAPQFTVCFLAECIGFCFSMEKPPFGVTEGNSMLSKQGAKYSPLINLLVLLLSQLGSLELTGRLEGHDF